MALRSTLIEIWKQKIKENRIAIGTVIRIIKKSVNNDIFNKIINITDCKEMWEKLYSIYSPVD